MQTLVSVEIVYFYYFLEIVYIEYILLDLIFYLIWRVIYVILFKCLIRIVVSESMVQCNS